MRAPVSKESQVWSMILFHTVATYRLSVKVSELTNSFGADGYQRWWLAPVAHQSSTPSSPLLKASKQSYISNIADAVRIQLQIRINCLSFFFNAYSWSAFHYWMQPQGCKGFSDSFLLDDHDYPWFSFLDEQETLTCKEPTTQQRCHADFLPLNGLPYVSLKGTFFLVREDHLWQVKPVQKLYIQGLSLFNWNHILITFSMQSSTYFQPDIN